MPTWRAIFRILVNGLALFLLVLTVALAVQSVRACWKTDIVSYFYKSTAADGTPRYHRQHFVSCNGRLSVSFESEPTPGMMSKAAFAAGRSWEVLAFGAPTYNGPLSVRDPSFLGFTYLGPDQFGRGFDRKSSIWRVGVPWVSLAGIAGLIPAIVLWRRFRRWHQAEVGHCPICGYDLRATPDRCPECGRAVAS
jgi:hypothetical protein